MVARILRLLSLVACLFFVECNVAVPLSSRLLHRFSDEMKTVWASRAGGGPSSWPEKGGFDYYQFLASNDVHRQKMKLGTKYPLLFPTGGGEVMASGNDFGWLHYTWIDIGTPSISFLVALDAGSDLLWVPCNCRQCARLSAHYYPDLDRNLSEYNPSRSRTSKYVFCSHRLCGPDAMCKSPKDQCHYTRSYLSENTSTSGLLVEDMLHLSSGSDGRSNGSVNTNVILGCGMEQTGSYLEGTAPDGVIGLGPGEISVPSILAKSGLARNSFSLCFNNEGAGRIYFGDEGPAEQQSTPFLPLMNTYDTYIVGVETWCVGHSCLDKTSFKAIVDSGASFSYFPSKIYMEVASEFDRQVGSTTSRFDYYEWKFCYRASAATSFPLLKLMFSHNNSLVIHSPFFTVHEKEGVAGICLGIQPSEFEEIGIIGQNFMNGYRIAFDREKMKLGWSASDCQALIDSGKNPSSPKGMTPNPLPTNDQQNNHSDGGGVVPAVAGRAPSKPSTATAVHVPRALFFIVILNSILVLVLARMSDV